ncbi:MULTISPECIES: DUF3352 domain-containing protein [unclassified Carboxylicivirga]|uniref:DUF3352 domain-containing protein n=1 Tax=Carboxylicivirga TaxID=1628153 RepID=UPI003D34211C
MKKGWALATVAICCLLLGYILFQVNRDKKYDNGRALSAIPADVAIIIKAESLEFISEAMHNTIAYGQELQHSALGGGLRKYLTGLDSLKTSEGIPISNVIGACPLKCSLHPQGKDQVSALFMFELPNRRKESEIERIVTQASQFGFTHNSRNYNAQRIHHIAGKGQNWYLNINKGLLLLSRSSLLIEASIRQQQTGSNWTDAADFKQIYKTIGAGTKLNVFFNFERLPAVLKSFAAASFQQSMGILQQQSTWGEFDIDINEKSLLFNGFINGNNKGILPYLMNDAKPQRSKLHQVLPQNTRAYMSYSLGSGSELKKRVAAFHKDNNRDTYQQAVHRLEQKYQFNPEDKFFDLLNGELGLAFGDYNYLQPEANGLLVLKLKSQSVGRDVCLEMLRQMQGEGRGQSVARVYQPDSGIRYPIYRGFSDDMIKDLLGVLFPKVPQRYVAFYEDNLLIADAPVVIEQFIYDNMLNKTLSNSKTHQSFLRNFSNRENAFVFCETAHFQPLLGQAFAPLFSDFGDDQKEALANFYGLGFQLSGTGNMTYATGFLQYMPARESEPRTVWQSLLDSTVCLKPALVKNHYTNEREVIVQDKKNNLYLMSNNGRVLWKKPLDGPILSEVTQVDYYRNNKLQYLFNTKKSLYLLDRNGNHVAKFPVRLPSEATNGMAVFDYDNNRNYRLFVACANRKIYLFDGDGNINTGWRFDKTDGRVSMPIQHFRSNGKDYIAFADDKRNYICSRRGAERVRLSKQFIRNVHSPYFIEGENKKGDCLVTTSSSGQLVKIDLASGKVRQRELMDIDGDHALSAFTMKGAPHYLITEPHRVTCLTNKGKEVFEKAFEEEINLHVDRYQFSASNTKFGVSEKQGTRIFLLNADGETYKGFPLKGRSRFSIGFLKSSASRFNLLVGGAENYVYNYQVN